MTLRCVKLALTGEAASTAKAQNLLRDVAAKKPRSGVLTVAPRPNVSPFEAPMTASGSLALP
jgi:hypothetical protein